MLENLREWFENLNVGKTGFKTCVFEKHFISFSCILFIKFNALRSFCTKLFCFFKIFFFQNFNRLNLFFNQSKIIQRFFLKHLILTCSNAFSKSFQTLSLSIRLVKAPIKIFCRFRPFFLQGFSPLRPVRHFYPSFCIYLHVSCIKS